MSRQGLWEMAPGEELPLGVSLADGLDSGVTLTGTPKLTVHTRSGDVYTELTAGTDYTVAGLAVNGVTFTDENGDTVAIGKGLTWFLTAPEDQGTYYVLAESDASDGSHPKTWRVLRVKGPGPAA